MPPYSTYFYNTYFMTEEQVKEGNELVDQLRKLRKELRIWSNACGWWSNLAVALNNEGGKEYVNSDFVDFDSVKYAAMARINAEIQKLQNKLSSL